MNVEYHSVNNALYELFDDTEGPDIIYGAVVSTNLELI